MLAFALDSLRRAAAGTRDSEVVVCEGQRETEVGKQRETELRSVPQAVTDGRIRFKIGGNGEGIDSTELRAKRPPHRRKSPPR
jgi:hypothetical protein